MSSDCVCKSMYTLVSLCFVAYSTPGSTAPNRFVGIGTRDNFLNIPQQTQVPRQPPSLKLTSTHPRLPPPSLFLYQSFPAVSLNLPTIASRGNFIVLLLREEAEMQRQC